MTVGRLSLTLAATHAGVRCALYSSTMASSFHELGEAAHPLPFAAACKQRKAAALATAEKAAEMQWNDLRTHLGALGASALDAEIALLCRGPHDAPGVELVRRFAGHLATTLETHGHFDAVQAYLHRLVQHHAAVLSLPQLRGPLTTLAAAQRAAAAVSYTHLTLPTILLV